MFMSDRVDQAEELFPMARVSKQTGVALQLVDEEAEEAYSAIREAQRSEVEEVVEFNPYSIFNPNYSASQRFLPLNKSELIDKGAVLFKETIKRLSKGLGFRDPILERVEVKRVKDGEVIDGCLYFTVYVFPLSQPGMNWSYEAVPLRGRRITIPFEIRNGDLYSPTKFYDSSGREYRLGVSEIAEMLMSGRQQPFVRKRAPRVERAWDIPRDYRAF